MIVIVKGIGHNLSSLKFALQRLHIEAVFSDNSEIIRKADRVILPGVGSANQAMKILQEKDLVGTIKQLTVPVLGICLGMQILMSSSEEGNVGTLNIISEKVQRIKPAKNLVIPHMGWNSLVNIDKNDPLLSNISDGSYAYFLHSFVISDTSYKRAETQHGDVFTSVISKDNFFGVQFHPEKSGLVGRKILENFLRL